MNPIEDVLFYQTKAEIALEEGDVEAAKVWASLATSASNTLDPRMTRPGRMNVNRTELMETVRNGGRPEIFGPQNPRRPPRPQPGGEPAPPAPQPPPPQPQPQPEPIQPQPAPPQPQPEPGRPTDRRNL